MDTRAMFRCAIATGALLCASPFAAQTPCVNGMAGPYPCNNVDLVSLRSVAQLGSNTSVADLWAWTDPLTGKEYAVVGTRTGTAFVDLSVPTVPVVTGFLPTHIGTGSLWRDVDVAGNWCYVGSEIAGHGLQVFDLTRLRNVTSPPETFTEDGWTGIVGNSHTIFADKQHPYVYAVGATSVNNGGLTVFDVSVPTSPTLVGTYTQDGYIHENMVITYNGPDTEHVGRQISFNFHTGSPDRITIVDVTDKSDMERISTVTYSGGSLCHQGWVTEDHRYLLMDDEGDETGFGHATRTRIFNIENLDTALFVGFFDGPNPSYDHNLYVHKGLVFESNYTSGLHILDATNVAAGSLSMSAYFDTYTSNNGTSYNGAWGNYPFLASGLVLVSDIQSGLFVLRPRSSLRVKMMLEGPFDQMSGLMRDSLRVKGLLPAVEPYTALGLPPMNSPAIGSASAPVLAVSGVNAIVDWVAIELRDPLDQTLVRARTIGLLQRDGDVVGVDGTSPVQFSVAVGDYCIAVRHRNHLGVMTALPKRVSIALKSYDLSNGSTTLFGTQPTRTIGTVNALWAGNAHVDDVLRYTNIDNDRDPILTAIGGVVPTNTAGGYRLEDLNMDGVVKYTNLRNDRDIILQNIGGIVPTASRAEQLP